MKSVVHYKFKSSKDCGQILFDGNVISVSDIKRGILKQTKMDQSKDWKNGAFDLWLSDVNTGQDYHDEKFLIQKNQTVIVKRIPKSMQVSPKPLTTVIPAGIPRNFAGANSKLFDRTKFEDEHSLS
jgi:hypothetical protein